jgi:hypothetical protein
MTAAAAPEATDRCNRDTPETRPFRDPLLRSSDTVPAAPAVDNQSPNVENADPARPQHQPRPSNTWHLGQTYLHSAQHAEL